MKVPAAPALIYALFALTSVVQAEVVDSTLELEGIRRIELAGPYELQLTLGDEEFVTVTTEEKNLDEIEAKVRGDLLTLGGKKRRQWNWFDFDNDRYNAIFTVQVRELSSLSNRGSGEVRIGAIENGQGLEISNQGSGKIALESFTGGDLEIVSRGSGNTRVDSINGKDLSIRSYGSGDIHTGRATVEDVEIGVHGSSDVRIAEGSAETVEISIHGSGDVDVGDLIAKQAEVSIFGSGDVKLHASEALDVSIHGSGDVRYSGNPGSVSRSVHGSGDIAPR